MSKPLSVTKAKWKAAVRERDIYCQAQKHDRLCRLEGHHAHHIVFKSHLTEEAMWLLDNGIWLSLYCHELAHRTHNRNIARDRKHIAVDAVNAIMPHHLRRQHFAEPAA